MWSSTRSTLALNFRPVDGVAVPWPLEVARYLVHVLAVYAIALAVYGLARRQLERRRAEGWSEHVVVLGSGPAARQLARNYRRKHKRVVLVGHLGLDEQDDLRHDRVLVVAADDEEAVSRLVAGADRVVVAGIDDDDTVRMMNQLDAESLKHGRCRHYLIEDPNLAESFRTGLDERSAGAVDVCCVAERVAGEVLRQFPPREDEVIAPPPVVIGHGAVAQELTRRMVRGWYRPADPVSVLNLGMPEEEHRALQTELGRVGTLHHLEVGLGATSLTQAVREHIETHRPTPLERERRTERGPLLIIAGMRDKDSVVLAQRLAAKVKGARVVALVKQPDSWRGIHQEGGSPVGSLHLLSADGLVTDPRVLETDRTRLLAQELFNDQRHWRDDIPSVFGTDARGKTNLEKLPVQLQERFLALAAAIPGAAREAGLQLARDDAVPLVQLPEELITLVRALQEAAGPDAGLDDYLWFEFAAQLPALTARAGVDLRRTAEPHIRFGAEEIEAMAREVHEAYRRAHRAGGKSTSSTQGQLPWSELTEFLKESNRGQARDIPAKLASVGRTMCTLSGEAPDTSWLADEDLQERLARWEHRRWEHLHRRAGYSRAAKTDHGRREHELLKPWDELDRERQLDRSAVESIPTLLAAVGLDTVPVGTRPTSQERHLHIRNPAATARPEPSRKLARGLRRPVAAAVTATASLLLALRWQQHRSQRVADASQLLRRAGYYRRIGRPVSAERLTSRKRWRTSDGQPLTAHPDDWILTGTDGSRWSINDEALRHTYTRLEDGRYGPTGNVAAVRLRRPVHVSTPEGDLTARPGDWLIRNQLGHVWAVDNARFRDRYQRAGPSIWSRRARDAASATQPAGTR